MGLRRFLGLKRPPTARACGAQTMEWFEGRSKVSVGRFTYGIETLTIHQWNEGAALRIGQFCSLARGAEVFLGGNHRTDWITTYPFGHVFQDLLETPEIEGHPATRGDVVIGNDVWIGSGAKIMSGVTIGDGAVIAAQALVTRDVAPYSIAGGNPCQPIRARFPDEISALLAALRWWDLPVEDIRRIAPLLSQAPTVALLHDLLARYRPAA